MSEADVIKQSNRPQSKTSIKKDLQALGLKSGDIILVHSSMSKIGWIAGREIAIIEVLLETVGPQGTIVMPSFTGENSQPELWQNPPVPDSWVKLIKQEMLPFDPLVTPTREMGAIAEAFWHYPGTLRSNHPQVSMSAHGKYAKMIIENHQLSPGFGRLSPLQRVYDLNGKVLLLGVDYNRCTCMHLAEVWLNNKEQWYLDGACIKENDRVVWKEFLEIAYDESDFLEIGKMFERENNVVSGLIGQAPVKLIEVKALCDFAFEWMLKNR